MLEIPKRLRHLALPLLEYLPQILTGSGDNLLLRKETARLPCDSIIFLNSPWLPLWEGMTSSKSARNPCSMAQPSLRT